MRRTRVAWAITLDAPDKRTETRFPELLTCLALAFPGVAVPGVGVPLNELAMGLLVLTALTRPPDRERRPPPWLVTGVVMLIGFLFLTSVDHHLVDQRRFLHLGLYAVLMLVIASGRVHLPSLACSAAVGLIASTVLSLAGYGVSGYGERLSGWIGDPNTAGLVLTVLGAISIGLIDRRRVRLVLILFIPVAVALTHSRTSLLALALAAAWVLVGRRAGPVLGVSVIAAGIYLVSHIPRELQLFGPFSDRTGSDALRERIIAQERLDIARSPLVGSGAGTATVDVQGNTFYYHSSYFALQREGGLLAVSLLLALVALLAFAVLRLPRARRNLWLEAALIALMVCALNLGEVLLDLPGAVAIGVLARHLMIGRQPPDDRPPDDRPPDDQAPNRPLTGRPLSARVPR